MVTRLHIIGYLGLVAPPSNFWAGLFACPVWRVAEVDFRRTWARCYTGLFGVEVSVGLAGEALISSRTIAGETGGMAISTGSGCIGNLVVD